MSDEKQISYIYIHTIHGVLVFHESIRFMLSDYVYVSH